MKTSSSKSWLWKVELASAHKKCDDYHEYFTHTVITMKLVKTPTKQPYCINIFIS